MRFYALVDGHSPGGFLRLTDALDVEVLTAAGAWAPAAPALAEDVLCGDAQEVPASAPELRAVALKAWQGLLDTLEAKKRHVRTPEGVQVFHRPLGAEIEGTLARPRLVSSAKEAVERLARGEHVELKRPKDATALLKELRKVTKRMEAAGEKAPLFDLCKVTVKDTSLFCVRHQGIPRVKMPQLTGVPAPGSRADALQRDEKGKVDLAPFFLEHLAKHGAKVEHTNEKASRLIPSQNELDGAKVGRMMRRLSKGETVRELFVSHDNYLVDGHHHWAATVGLDASDDVEDLTMRVARVDLSILELLDLANEFAAGWGLASRGVETKATRHVRTPEGAKKYGVPIGTVIIADTLEEMYQLLDLDSAKRIKKRKAAVKFYAQRRDGLSVADAQAKADEYEKMAVEAELALQVDVPDVPDAPDVTYPQDGYDYLNTYTDDELQKELERGDEEWNALDKAAQKYEAMPEDQVPPALEGGENRLEEVNGRKEWLEEQRWAIEARQKARQHAHDLAEARPEPPRPKVGETVTFTPPDGGPTQQVEVLELGGPRGDWMVRVRTEDGQEWGWAKPEELTPPVSSARALLDAEPWNASKEDVLTGKVPGLRLDPTISAHLAGHRRRKDVVTVSPGFLDDSPLGRFVLIAHEVGHDVADALMRPAFTSGSATAEVLRPFRRGDKDAPLTSGEGGIARYDNPFGLNDLPNELLADAYQYLLTHGNDYQDPDSPFSTSRRNVLDLVAAKARELGLPDDRLPGRPTEKVTPAPKPKKGGPAAVHPPSGRPDVYLDPVERGGGGPLYGYTVGQRAWRYAHGDWQLVEVTDGPTEVTTERKWVAGRDGQGHETKSERTQHHVTARRVNEDGTPLVVSYYDKEAKKQVKGPDPGSLVGVEDMVPLGVRDAVTVDPGYRVAPELAAIDEPGRFPLETLLPADSFTTMKRVFKKKSVALDTQSDVYEGHMTPELVALANAKADGLRALGRALGFDDDETEAAVTRLDEMLDGWAMEGGIFEKRLAMHAAVKRLREGAPADDADTRAMLLQRTWSNATWDQVYGPDERPKIARFVQNEHAAVLAAADALTKPTYDPDVESGDIYAKKTNPPLLKPEDVDLDAWTLTSWTVTPDGVHAGWVGRYIASVMLSTEVSRDEVWLNVWSEPKFRSRGLRAPGEVIVDNRRGLNLGNVKVDVLSADESTRPSNSFGGVGDALLTGLTTAFAEHVRRHPDSTPQAAAAALELAYSKNLDSPFFDADVRARARKHGLAQTPEEVWEGVRKPLGARYGEGPREPKAAWRYYNKETGELLDRGADKFGSSRYEPPWKERDRYERRLELDRDAVAEAVLDDMAELTHERGWSQSTLNRYRMAFGRWLDAEPRLRALRQGKFVQEYMTQEAPTPATYKKRLADVAAEVAAAEAEARAGAERLGLTLDAKELEAFFDTQWSVERAPNQWTSPTSPSSAAAPLEWWGKEEPT